MEVTGNFDSSLPTSGRMAAEICRLLPSGHEPHVERLQLGVFLRRRKNGHTKLHTYESGDPMITRRKFLATATCMLAATRLRAQGQGKLQVALTVPTKAVGPQMPLDFVGLSYEVQQLVDPSFFSAQNSGLIREFKALAPHGVLR